MLETNGIQLIVHIGIGKTGTSSIQHYLNQVSELSSEFLFAGYLFERVQNKRFGWQRVAGTPDFVALPFEQQKAELETALKDCIEEAKLRGLSKIIWSNEALCEMAWLPEMIKHIWDGSLTTLCFVREPASYSVSAYYQWGIKHKIYDGEVPSYAEFVKKHHFEHHTIIEKWKQVSSAFHILNYDKTENVVLSFCERLSLSFKEDCCHQRQNSALDTTHLYASAIANSFDSKPCMLQLPKELTQMPKVDEKWFFSKLPTHEQISKHVADCEHDTKRLNELLIAGNDKTAKLETVNISSLLKPIDEVQRCAAELSNMTSALVIKQHNELRIANRNLSHQVQKTKRLEESVRVLQEELHDLRTSHHNTASSLVSMNKEIHRLSQVVSKTAYARVRRFFLKMLNYSPASSGRFS